MPNEFRVKRGLIVESSGSASGSVLVTVDGVAGRLFTVVDTFSGSLFSVNTVAGLPVIEAFSDNTVRIGQFGQRALFVSQSRVGIGKETSLNSVLDVSGSVIVTGSINASGGGVGVATIGGIGIVGGNFAAMWLAASSAPSGTNYAMAGDWGNGELYINRGSSLFFTLNAGATPQMTLTSAGNLSLGKSTANARFDVSGSALISGSLLVSGSVTTYVTFTTTGSSNYTLVSTDVGRMIEMTASSACTVTVPSSSVTNFPIGSQITVIGNGAGQVTFNSGSVNVLLRSAGARYRLTQQYSAATLTKRGTDEWYLFGDLTL